MNNNEYNIFAREYQEALAAEMQNLIDQDTIYKSYYNPEGCHHLNIKNFKPLDFNNSPKNIKYSVEEKFTQEIECFLNQQKSYDLTNINNAPLAEKVQKYAKDCFDVINYFGEDMFMFYGIARNKLNNKIIAICIFNGSHTDLTTNIKSININYTLSDIDNLLSPSPIKGFGKYLKAYSIQYIQNNHPDIQEVRSYAETIPSGIINNQLGFISKDSFLDDC